MKLTCHDRGFSITHDNGDRMSLSIATETIDQRVAKAIGEIPRDTFYHSEYAEVMLFGKDDEIISEVAGLDIAEAISRMCTFANT